MQRPRDLQSRTGPDAGPWQTTLTQPLPQTSQKQSSCGYQTVGKLWGPEVCLLPPLLLRAEFTDKHLLGTGTFGAPKTFGTVRAHSTKSATQGLGALWVLLTLFSMKINISATLALCHQKCHCGNVVPITLSSRSSQLQCIMGCCRLPRPSNQMRPSARLQGETEPDSAHFTHRETETP